MEFPPRVARRTKAKMHRVHNFLIQEESASRIRLDCPPGFTQYEDSCVQDKEPPLVVEKSFGETLQFHRLKRKMSQAKLARTAGFDHSYVSKLESGGRIPTRDAIDRLAKALEFYEGDYRYDELLSSAGYRPLQTTIYFSSAHLYRLDSLHREAPERTKEEIDIVLQFLIESLLERARLLTPDDLKFKRPEGT